MEQGGVVIVILEHEALLEIEVAKTQNLKVIIPADPWRADGTLLLCLLRRLMNSVLWAKAGDLPVAYRLAHDVLSAQALTVP